MSGFQFYHPVEVRYADIDAQRHVNNVAFFTYMESARARYLQRLGLWDGQDFMEIGIILVQAECRYLRPISYGTEVRVGVRTESVGHKSLKLAYRIEDAHSGEALGEGGTVLVAYDYRQETSIPVPGRWREILTSYDHPTSGELRSIEA